MIDENGDKDLNKSSSPDTEADKPFAPPIPEYPTLRPKPFSKDYQPAVRGRPPGKRNRKTIIKELLDMAASKAWRDKHKEVGWEYEPQQLRDQVLASLALKALGGDIAAINTLLDSEFGKIPQINTDVDKPEKSHDEILRELIEPKKQIEGDSVEGKEESD